MVYHPFRHLGLKFVSVAIAFLIWLAVAGEHVVERSLRIPLELQNMPERLEIIGDVPPGTVDVRVRGSSGILGQVGPGDLVAVVDLLGARPGRRLFHLSPDQVRAPFGVEVAQVNPSTLALAFEASGSRVVPIKPAIEGKPAEGFEVASVTVDPPGVEVEGPETALANLEEVITEPISVAGASRSLREHVTIGVQTSSIRLRSAHDAVVTIEVLPIPVERVFRDVAVQPRSVREGLVARLAPGAATVTVKGPQDRVDAIEAESVRVFVDLAGLGPGRYNRQVQVEPLPGVEILQIEPQSVRVTLR